jgi:hypothetical protein
MMKKQILFSKGVEFTNINGNINKKEYKAIYDGKKAKMLLKDRNKKYYIEANNNDIKAMLNQKPSKDKLDNKLLMLLDRKKKKKKKKKKKSKKRRTSKRLSKQHYKKKTPSKRKTKKNKTPTKKNTIQNLLPDKFLKTII